MKPIENFDIKLHPAEKIRKPSWVRLLDGSGLGFLDHFGSDIYEPYPAFDESELRAAMSGTYRLRHVPLLLHTLMPIP